MGVKIGMVGLGQFGSGFVKLFKAHPLVDRIVLCDCERDKIRKFADDPFMADKLSRSECCSSLDELIRLDLDAVVVITQPWLHAPQCIKVLNSGKYVYSAVPLIELPDDSETLDLCGKLIEAVKSSGCHYMLGETTIYRPQTMFCRRMAAAGNFGEYIYAEGEYIHDVDGGINGWSNLRDVIKKRTSGIIGNQHKALMAPYKARGMRLSPMSYPTHSISGPIHVMKTRALKVSAYGTPNTNNDPFFEMFDFSNVFALYQLANGASLRIAECREIGATASFQDKVRNNEIWKLHQRAYKKYFARTRKGTMSKPEFEKWARDAERLRDRALKSYERSRTLEEKNLILEKLKADLNCV